MSIKKRFFISYILGMILPVILLLVVAQFEPEEERNFLPDGSALIRIEAVKLEDPERQKDMDAFVKRIAEELQKDPSLRKNVRYIKNLNEEMEQYDPYGFLAYDETDATLIPSVWTERENYFEKKSHESVIKHVILFIVCYLLIYNILAYYMAKSITKPLNKLKLATEEIANLNFSHRIGTHSKDEIGEVTKAFDRMAEETEKAVESMRQYENNRKELLANISHDLKTPLTAIKGSIAAINDGIADTPEKKEKYWQMITSRIQSMQHMIDELFLFSKLDLQKEPFEFQPVLLHRFVEDVVGEWKLAQSNGHIDIAVQYDKIIKDRVALDLEKMNRVLVNILDNAVKYAQVEPILITVAIVQHDEKIRLSIKDNGVGVPSKDVQRLFDRFYRGEPSRDSAITGSGLGLSIARKIVNAHEGIIMAESDVNQGMCIQIEFNSDRGGNELEENSDH